MGYLNDLKPGNPERAAYVRGFVQAVMVAHMLGHKGVADLIGRTSLTQADITHCGLSLQDTAYVMRELCAGVPAGAPDLEVCA